MRLYVYLQTFEMLLSTEDSCDRTFMIQEFLCGICRMELKLKLNLEFVFQRWTNECTKMTPRSKFREIFWGDLNSPLF